jgi:glycosyltransferase involved in cell wall biosynthesis
MLPDGAGSLHSKPTDAYPTSIQICDNHMTLVGVACVKNEEDIIEPFVRHNLFYLDKLILLNHGSTDGTSRILDRLIDEGLPLVVENDPSLGKFQGEKMTRLMLRAVREHQADWVFLLDADELIRCPSDTLVLPGGGDYAACLKVACRTYQIHETDDHTVINPVERIRHRFEKEPCEDGSMFERRFFLKAIIPRSLALTPGACVVQGNHFIVNSDREPAHEYWSGFDYAHYSLRTVGQYTSKIAIGTLQHRYRSSPRANMDSFYLAHLDELRSDFEGFARRFHERSPSYLEVVRTAPPAVIRDPLGYRGGPLRHTPIVSDYSRLVSNLIGYAETLAGALAKQTATRVDAAETVEELTRLELRCPGAKTVVPREITSGVPHSQTVRFPLPTGWPPAGWHLRIENLSSVVELRRLRWIFEDGREHVVSGSEHSAAGMHILFNACRLHHDDYFVFIKGTQPAVIELNPPVEGNPGPIVALELDVRTEPNATAIGSRLLHNDNIDRLMDPMEHIARLERKIARLSTLSGAIGFQFYRFRRAVAGRFLARK